MNKNKILCAVLDKKAKLFESYMTFDYEQAAVRAFQMSCDKNEAFQKWPEDFDFYKIGEIDIETGNMKQEKKFLAAATSFIKPVEK